MQLTRYESKFNDSILALHRSAIEGFCLGMSQLQDEADLMAIDLTYLSNSGNLRFKRNIPSQKFIRDFLCSE